MTVCVHVYVSVCVHARTANYYNQVSMDIIITSKKISLCLDLSKKLSGSQIRINETKKNHKLALTLAALDFRTKQND